MTKVSKLFNNGLNSRADTLGRLGKPSEVAGAMVYIVSEDGEYITGQVIDINGGLYI